MLEDLSGRIYSSYEEHISIISRKQWEYERAALKSAHLTVTSVLLSDRKLQTHSTLMLSVSTTLYTACVFANQIRPIKAGFNPPPKMAPHKDSHTSAHTSK